MELRGYSHGRGIDTHAAAVSITLEGDYAINQGKKSIVSAHPYVFTGVEFGSTLAHENISSANDLASVLFYSTTLRVAVASVARTSNPFLCAIDIFLS